MINKSILCILMCIVFQFYGCKTQQTNTSKDENSTTEINEIFTPNIGDIQQVVKIETDDSTKPILLFLSGGPGSSMINNADTFTTILKEKFTLVHWDQRDAGKTLTLNPSPIQPSVGQMRKDTYEVIKFILKELNQEKIYLLGSSWGNVLGFYMVENHPELLHAYIASNPVISQLESEKQLLTILKNHFKENPLAVEELASVRIPFETDEYLFYLRKWLFYKDGKKFALDSNFKKGFMQWSETWSPAWNEVMNIDLPKTLQKVSCPVYFFVGKNDIQTATEITERYFFTLKAPKKAIVRFENSGHQIHQDEPEKFQQSILNILTNN